MKTSKKLLSFFLAVVMVVTTCSVGFSAFAAEKNTDIWSTNCESKDAYAAIDGLVNQYVPGLLIDLIPGALENIYKKYAADYNTTADNLSEEQKAKIKANATLADILEALVPTIANVDLFGAAMTQEKFIEAYYPSASPGDFDYLETAGEGDISFFTMFNICAKFTQNKDYISGKNDTIELNLSSEAKKELEALYQQLKALADKPSEITQYLNEVDDIAIEIARKAASNFEELSLAELKALNFDFSPETAPDGSVLVDRTQAAETFISYNNAKFNSRFAYGLIPENGSLNERFAYAIYYFRNGAGQYYTEAAPFDYMLKAANETVTFSNKALPITIDGNTQNVTFNAEGITLDNLGEKLDSTILAAFGLENNEINRSKADAAILRAYNREVIKPLAEDVYNSELYVKYLKGAAVISGKYTPESYDKAYLDLTSQTVVDDQGKETVLTLDDLLLTQDQRKEIANEIKANCVTNNAWDEEKLINYFSADDTKFALYYGGTAVQGLMVHYIEYGNRMTVLRCFGGQNFANRPNLPIRFTTVDDTFYNSMAKDYALTYAAVTLANDAYDNEHLRQFTTLKNGVPAHDVNNDKLKVIDAFQFNDFSYGDVNVPGLIDKLEDANFHYDMNIELEEDEVFNTTNYTNLVSATGVEVVNGLINKMIGGYIDTIGLLFESTTTPIDLHTAILDIYKRAHKNATATVFELLPVLLVIVDEVLLPSVVNSLDDIDPEAAVADTGSTIIRGLLLPAVFGFLGRDFMLGYKLEYNAALGFDGLLFDLNEILPDLLHWLYDGTDAEGITYYGDLENLVTDKPVPLKYGGADTNIKQFYFASNDPAADIIQLGDLNTYTAIDADGNELEYDGNTIKYRGGSYTELAEVAEAYPNAVFTYYYTFESNVPHLTGVYAADLFLRDISMDTLTGMLSAKLGGEIGGILGEVISEIGVLLTAAVDDYLADPVLANQVKTDKDGRVVSKGLNNIMVALPQLFDIMENLAAEKYNVPEDAWVYCYDGKIANTEVDVIKRDQQGNGTVIGTAVTTTNTLFERFKSYASTDDSNRSVDILDCFVEALVENWLDAIFSLLNNVIATDNEVSNNLPIIAGLLNSIGGLGEQSVLTDILNSVFQLTRDNEYSFTFSTNHSDPNNNLTGLSKQNAYFLLSNIDRLTEVITNLIAHFDGNNEGGTEETPSEPSPSPEYKKIATTDAKATSHNYSADDLSNTKDLIGNLDKLLSSLLSDSTINDFSLNSTENLLAGVISLLDRFLGNDVKLDKALTTDIVVLVNQYLYFITGESDNLTADGKKVNAKKVYSNDALTGLVVETYALIEKIADRLLNNKDGLGDFSDMYVVGDEQAKYNLFVEAIDGLIAPDAISVRLGDYGNAQEKFAETKYRTWTDMSEASSRNGYKNLKVDWGFKDGNKEGFYEGLTASLRLVTSILGVLFIETGWYDTILTPVLGAFCDKNDIKLESFDVLKKDAEETGYYDKTFIAIITPVSEWLTALLNAPASTLIKSIQGLAGLLDDNNTKAGTIQSILNGVLKPIKNEVNGLAKILNLKTDKLGPLSPTLYGLLNTVGKVLNIDTVSALLNIDILGYSLSELTGSNLINIINTAIADTGIVLKQISWSKIYSSTPEAALVYVLEYVIETLLENKNLDALTRLINNDIATMIFDALRAGKVDAKGLLDVLNTVLEATDSPRLAYWTFAQYLQELTENFKYPAGITKAMADNGVDTLDNLVRNLFPLLGSFGVNLGADDLKGILDSNLFKNELLTKLAVTLYSALDGLDPTIKSVLKGLGIVSSTQDVAAILTDSSYGSTFSSAANTIKAQSSWSNVKNVNWGFTDGSAKAQQGFVNALVAILRPLNNVLNVFLNEGSLELNDVAYDAIMAIDVKTTTAKKLEIGGNIVAEITYSMKNGVLTLTIDDATRYRSTASTIKFDFSAVKDLKDLKIEGTNGYNSAIIPLLEAFKCTDIKTYSQYRSDVNSAKDNLLLDILNPIVGASNNSLLTKLLDKPFAVLTDLLPNIAMYLDAHGLSQLVDNLLAPVTGLIADIAETIDVNAILKSALGTDLNGLVAKYLGVKVNIDLTNLSQLNLEDLVIPLVNMLLADNGINIKLPNINWNALISLGDKMSYTSAATGADGNYLTGKMVGNVDQGKVLITVLRYIAQALTDNTSSIKSLILGIDSLKKNKSYDMIAAILTSVFNTISTASADQIVAAIFYLVSSEPTNAFWDYTKYKTGQYSFSYPETVDVDFLKNLPPMLDGLVGGLVDLNGLIGENLFTDSLVSKLAKGLYGAIEGVKINDNMNLTALLAQTDIDFSTANVAKLLVDKDYGKTFEGAASVIRNAGSWKNVNENSLKWGVTDRDSFFHALVAVLRPLYGVLDVLLNDADLGLFDLVRIPGSNGYTSSIVPLMEAFSMYNIKTQYQYRQDINKEYDAILLDIINPIWDKVEDILNAPIQTLMAVIPNLALFIGNDGLCQIIDNLLTPVSALADAIRPIVDLNDLLGTLLPALNVDLNSLLGKIGIKNFKLDIYDLNKTLKQVLGGDAIIPLVNNILGIIKIKGTPLGLKLNAVDWLQLASHGTTIVSASQAATYGSRIFVEGDSSETLIAFLRYLINTINSGDNFDKVSSLIGGLLGDNVADNVSDIISQVLGMLQGDTDEVISSLVELLQTLA